MNKALPGDPAAGFIIRAWSTRERGNILQLEFRHLHPGRRGGGLLLYWRRFDSG